MTVLESLQRLFGTSYSDKALENFIESLRHPPLTTTLRVNTLKCTREKAKEDLEEYFKQARRPFTIEPSADFPDVLLVHCIGPSEFEASEKEVIVDCACAAALLRGADLFVPGVLGMSEGIRKNDQVSVWADLEGKCLKGWKRHFESGPKLFIGNGICLFSREEVFSDGDQPKGVAVCMTRLKYILPSLNGCLTGTIFLQNLPSIIAVHTLNPTSGSRVLDMCAAPGGKTCHLAALMQNRGQIIALDKNRAKVEKIEQNCRLLGVDIVMAMVADSTKLQVLGDPFTKNSFDFILLDPPCSGLGQRPNLNLRDFELSEKFLSGHAPYQRQLFETAWFLLKPGGTLVYSTCTINPSENEENVAHFLNLYQDASLVPIRNQVLEKYCQPGLNGLNVCRFWPNRDDPHTDQIGFFIAKFKKG